MAQFKRIMVGLDFTDMDANILDYTKMVKDLFKPEIIYFIHAESDLDLDSDLLNELGMDSTKPADEELSEKLMATVEQHFSSDGDTEIQSQIVEGAPFKEMLHWSHIKKVDLLIVGRKNRINGKGVLPQKLTRKIDASVLFVPENYNTKPIERVSVPIDFSRNSKWAIETVAQLFGNRGAAITCTNCYTLPMGWHKIGKSKEEFKSIMLGHAKKKYEDFISEADLSIECDVAYSYDPNDEPSEELYEMAQQGNADLIVIGARGKTDMATVVLGSTTEKLVGEDKDIPLLVIKKQGETIGFLEALFKLS